MNGIKIASALAVIGALAMSAVPAKAADEIVLGLTNIKSGPLKTPGEGTEVAVDIAVAEINAAGGVNGKKLRIVKFDTGTDPKQAVVAARKFASDDGALGIIGPFSSGEAGAAFPIGERLGIVQIPNASSAPGLTKGKSYAFRLTEDESKQYNRLLTSMKKKGVPSKHTEIFYVTDERISKIVGTFLMPKLMKNFGMATGKPIGFSYTSFDLAPQATKAMQAKPNLIAVASVGPPAAKVLKEMRRQGFKGRMIGSQLFADPNNIELFGNEADGTLFASGFWYKLNAETRAFTKKFVAEVNRRGIKRPFPHHVDAQAYDIVYLFKQAMEKAGVTGDPSKLKAERTAIRDALNGIVFSGITGKNVCFDANGDAELPGYIIEMKGGQWTLFDKHPADKCS
jgi:branched-chain amino acid transport system substrate-binding protein